MTKKPTSRVRPFRIPIERGMWSGGDAMLIPEGFLRKVRNLVRRAGAWLQRPQFTYDSPSANNSLRGLGVWYDNTNLVTRLMVSELTRIYAKATSGESWGADLSSNLWTGLRILDEASYRGVWFALGPVTGLVPGSIQSYDGTTLKRAGFEEMAIFPYSLIPYKERLFFGGVLWQFTSPMNTTGFSSSMFYDAANSSWTKTSITASSVVDGTTTTFRITPTSTTAAMLRASLVDNLLTQNGLADTGVRFTCRLRSTDRQYAMPVSVQLRWGEPWTAAQAYTVGALVVPATANNYLYQCTVAGTSHATVEPTWPTTVGTTVADDTATWMCVGSDILAKTDATIPSASSRTDPTQVTVFARIPQGSMTLNATGAVDMVLTLYNADTPTITLATMDFGYQDGKAITDITKANWGQMTQAGYVTEAECIAPFPSADDVNGYTVNHSDYLYWSEPLEPRRVLGQNYYRLTETPGPITGVKVIAGKLCVSKRQSLTVFGATDDPDVPVLPEGEAKLFGWLNPKACGVFEDYVYFVGENEIFKWRPGMDAPEPLCGDAMREEIMARDTTTTTTGNGIAFTNQPTNDGCEAGSSSAADTTQVLTLIGTTQGTDTVVVETKTLTGTTFVATTKTDWGVILAGKLSAACAGTVTVREASGDATIFTFAPGVTSKGVETVATAQQSSYNGLVQFVASGATTKQIGLGGTNPAGTAIYDSQALTGATAAWSNSIFFTVTELYTGDVESSRTVTETAYSWCEDQSGSIANRALLAIDQKNRDLLAYTQNGRIYVKDLDSPAGAGWSFIDAGGGTGVNPYGYPVCDMIYNPNTQRMYFAFAYAPAGTAGLARLDATVAEAEDSISSSGTSTVISELWLKPLELFTPFFELMLERIRLKLRVTDSQSGQTLTAYVSKDQGVTWPKSNQVVIDPLSSGEYRRGRITLWQKGLSLMVRLLKSGKGGADNFAVSHVEADVQVLQGEYPEDQFTAGSASL